MIGGNLEATFQLKCTLDNELGEHIPIWNDLITIKGWLDLSSGTSTYSHKTKVEESTYMLLTDYNDTVQELEPQQCRCIVKNKVYEVQKIDDPMGIHDHLEITLKLIGIANSNSTSSNSISEILQGDY